MKYLETPWVAAILLLGFFLFVEGLHMTEHEHCRECPVCEQEY